MKLVLYKIGRQGSPGSGVPHPPSGVPWPQTHYRPFAALTDALTPATALKTADCGSPACRTSAVTSFLPVDQP